MLDSAGTGIIIMGLGAAAVIALVQYVMSRLRPKELAGDHGSLHPNNSMVAVGILIAWGVGCAGLFYHLAIANNVLAILVAILGFGSIPFMAKAFTSIYDISWNTDRITGPSATWYSPFSTERRDIACKDIVDAGQDKWGNYFVESKDGTRIRWNWFYSGYPELLYFVEDVCPHLFPDLDDPQNDIGQTGLQYSRSIAKSASNLSAGCARWVSDRATALSNTKKFAASSDDDQSPNR